jgi:hypothetical protein
MATIVGVHGILYDYLEETTASAWGGAIREGLRRANYADPGNVTTRVAFYGELFHPQGVRGDLPHLTVEDLHATECALLLAFANPLASNEVTRLRMLRSLLRRQLFGVAAGPDGERALLFGLRQIRLYLRDDGIRARVHERFAKAVAADTRVVVGHSLGSIVAYECLCTSHYPQVRTFVSLGSPLGLPRIIFDCLRPAPVGGRGQFPPVDRWTNVADKGDVMARVKQLRPFFGDGAQIVDAAVDIGWQSHDVLRYLTAQETGKGIALGLG